MEIEGKHIFGQLDQLPPRPLRYRVVIAILFGGSLLAWLLIKPASHDIVVSVDNLAQAASLLVAILLCFNDLLRPHRYKLARSAKSAQLAQSPTSPVVKNAAQRWIPRLFGLTILSVILWTNRLALLYTNLAG